MKEVFGGNKTSRTLAHYGITGRGMDTADDPTKTHTSQEIRRKLGLDESRGMFTRGMEMLEHWSNASDAAVRTALYELTMEETGNPVLALRRARDIINFDIQGASKASSFLRQTVPFMGVYMNDLNNLYKGLISGSSRLSEGQKMETRIAIVNRGLQLAFLTMLYTLAVGDDDDYKKLDDSTRMRSLIVPGTNFRVPVPSDGVGLLFKTLPEEITRYMMAEGIESGDAGAKFGRAMFHAITNMGMNFIPSAPKVGIELVLNKSFFTDHPVVGKSKEFLEPYQQHAESTSEFTKQLALSLREQGFDMSPLKVEYLWRGLTGQIGGAVLGMAGALTSAATGRVTPTKNIEDYPELRAFTYQGRDKAVLEDYYEMRDQINRVARTYKDYIALGKGKEAVEYLQRGDNMKSYQLRGLQTRVDQDMTKYRVLRKNILERGSPDIPKEKRLTGDEMKEQLTKVDELQAKYLRSIQLPTLRAYANVEPKYETTLSKLVR